MDPVNLKEFEALARERMDPAAYDYYVGGALDEITLSENRAAFDRLRLAYRVLVDVSERDLSTTVLGEPLSMPAIVAPTAFHQLAHPEGELAMAQGAASTGTVMVLSTMSNLPVEEVVAAADGPVWFQLYVYRDRGATAALLERVAAAGCRAVVLTVDAPFIGYRERDVRHRFTLPEGMTVSNLVAAGYGRMPATTDGSGLAAYVARQLDPSLSWSDLEWLRGVTDLPILIKGIVRADDAVRAAASGAAGIVVSNHGGRQLDTAPATLDVLPDIAHALERAGVSEEFELLMDGGVRRGTDVVKALALGARAVMVGRPTLWGLAVDGADGVCRVLELLRNELDLAMALCGCRNVGEIGRDLVIGS